MNLPSYLDDYREQSDDTRLKQFLGTLSLTNHTADYFVDWRKAEQGTHAYEKELYALDDLIGKEDIEREALKLFNEQPDLLKAVPSLLASRDTVFTVVNMHDGTMNYETYNFKNLDERPISDYVHFCKECGLLDFLAHKARKSLVDYVNGVEVGMGTNGRKNRSGTIMENMVAEFISRLCDELHLEHKEQATRKYIQEHWNRDVPVDKSKRRYDEALYDPRTGHIWLLETNYYHGGGSKLKAVCGEFQGLNSLICKDDDKITFVWVTDGRGWLAAQNPMAEAFENIDYIFNLAMMQKGYLKQLVEQTRG